MFGVATTGRMVTMGLVLRRLRPDSGGVDFSV